MIKFFRSFHKWAGLICILFLILFSISGIILNHRETVSEWDVNRSFLTSEYRYDAWNNAAVKSTLKLSSDSILIYGNIGIWLTDSTASKFSDYNQGFRKGADNRKVFKISSFNRNLLAGTQFGLFVRESSSWKQISLPVHEKNVVDMWSAGDSLLVMTRSHIITTKDLIHFNVLNLPAPIGYDNKIGLFKTMWVIHSGEIYGVSGKLLVDVIALVLIFLCLTGLIVWIKKEHLKLKSLHSKSKKFRKRHILLRKIAIWNFHQELHAIRKSYKWNLKWHNKIGWITLVFVLITATTGMFLRPPFLIAIGESRVGKIPHTELDSDNAWFDILRRIIWIEKEQKFIISTSEGFYEADKNWNEIKAMSIQIPASVMGVTVFKETEKGLMVGSFEGLFSYDFKTHEIWDVLKNKKYIAPKKKGPPVGDFKISGYSDDFEKPVVFDYTFGTKIKFNKGVFPEMPAQILKVSHMSLWNLMLEVHTGRIFQFALGLLYILIVPLLGLSTILLSISGFVVWWKFHRGKD